MRYPASEKLEIIRLVTLEMALDAARLEEASVLHRPRLLSDNGSSYISDDLAKWLERRTPPVKAALR